MSGMSTVEILLIAWGVVSVVFAILLMYRFLIAMKEEDTLILSAAESKMEEEQRQVLKRLDKIKPYVMWSGWLSAALLVAAIGMWVIGKLRATELG